MYINVLINYSDVILFDTHTIVSLKYELQFIFYFSNFLVTNYHYYSLIFKEKINLYESYLKNSSCCLLNFYYKITSEI